MKKFGFAALVVMSLAFVGCDDGNSIAPSGATDCGSNTCSAGQYCEDPTFSTCSNGCLANTNCSSDQECVKAAGEQVGSCQNKTSSGTCPATPCGSGQVCSNGTCVTQTTGCPATPCGTGLTCENGTCVSTSTGGECAAFCTKAIACGAPVTAEVCAARALPYLRLERPAWTPDAGDDWTMIDREEEAASHVRPGATVFLATGRQTLAAFAGLRGCRVLCRQIDPPTAPFPFEGGEFVIGRPPFSVEREERLFAQLGVDWIVVKNAGGEESRSKLIAARNLGIPVLMIRRPPPVSPRVETVEAALDWVRRM